MEERTLKHALEDRDTVSVTLSEALGQATDSETGKIDYAKIDKFDGLSGDAEAIKHKLRGMGSDLADLDEEIEFRRLKARSDRAQVTRTNMDSLPIGGADSGPEDKWSNALQHSKILEGYTGGVTGTETLEIDARQLLSHAQLTTTGWPVQELRSDRYVQQPLVPPDFIDIVPLVTIPPNTDTYRWINENFSPNAAPRAESATSPEGTITMPESSAKLEWISVWIPVTDQTLRFNEQGYGRLSTALSRMIRRELEKQAIAGSGTSPNLRGLINTTGVTSLTAAAGDDERDHIKSAFAGIQKVRTAGGSRADFVVMHTDLAVQLAGSPSLDASSGEWLWWRPDSPVQPTLWQRPVLFNDDIPASHMLIGDYRGACGLATTGGVEIRATDSHASLFPENVLAIRAGVYAAMCNFNPPAFTIVDTTP